MGNIERKLIPNLTAVTVTLFTYFYFFQIPNVISKRCLGISVLIGSLTGLLCWILLKKYKEQNKRLLIWQALLSAVLVAILFVIRFGIPNNYLFSPQVQVEISIPSIADGGQAVSIESVQSDPQTIWHSNMPAARNLQHEEDAILLLPEEHQLSILEFDIKAWERVVFIFPEIPPDMPVWLSVNGHVEKLYAPEDSVDKTLTSVFIPGFWETQLLSDISVFVATVGVFYFFFHCLQLLAREKLARFNFKKGLLILFILFVLVSLVPLNPQKNSVMRDSGVFLYTAQGLLSGKVPYKDIWDHKGPVIYLINALGLLLARGEWGIWVIEIASALLSLLILYKLLLQQSGIVCAISGSAVFSALYFFFLLWGNVAEEYALPASLLALFLFAGIEQSSFSRNRWRYFLIGLLFGFSFFLRPNLISTYVAIGIITLISNLTKKEYLVAIKSISWMLLGFAIILICVSSYFVLKAAFPDFIQAVFVYNFAYSNFSGFADLFQRITWIFKKFPFFMAVALLGWIYLVARPILHPKEINADWLLAVLTGFIIELILCNMSGRNYRHYFLSLLPYVCLLSGVFLAAVLKSELIKKLVDWNVIIQFVSSTTLGVLIISNLVTMINVEPVRKIQQEELLGEISTHLSANDTLLIWGAETATNYLLNIPAPNRFSYNYPLMNCDFIQEKDVSDFVLDLSQEKPVIIDSAKTNPEVSPLAGGNPGECSTIDPIFMYISENYQKGTELSNGWLVYKPINK